MKKFIYPVLATLVLFTGCGDTKPSHMKKHKMFQSVAKEQAILVQDTKDKQYCVKCGMDLIRFYKTSHTAMSEDGKRNFQYCSIHCLEDHLGEGINLKNPKVVDVSSLKLLPVSNVTYVVGSKVRGTMSKVSKYAFSTLKEAQKFQAKNGGELMNFNEALTKAKEDFKHYNRH